MLASLGQKGPKIGQNKPKIGQTGENRVQNVSSKFPNGQKWSKIVKIVEENRRNGQEFIY